MQFAVPKLLLLVLISALTCTLYAGCETNSMAKETGAVGGSKLDVSKEYEALINKYSAGEAEYSGFYNNFQYKATILNTVVRAEILSKQNTEYQWDHAKLVAETDKSDKEAAASTVYFLSFYTPDRHNDNLADTKTIWRIYLDVGGQRIEGHARKVHQLITETQAAYPYHTRWNTPYTLMFPVPTATVQSLPSSITITGPLGTKVVRFTPLSN